MVKLTPRNEEYDKHQNGETIRKEEFGVVYPNGKIFWVMGNAGVLRNLHTAEGRKQFQDEWKALVDATNVPTTDLVFLKRVVTTKFNDAEPVID